MMDSSFRFLQTIVSEFISNLNVVAGYGLQVEGKSLELEASFKELVTRNP
jgi:hypothetical protein